jgi:hypothetical protein
MTWSLAARRPERRNRTRAGGFGGVLERRALPVTGNSRRVAAVAALVVACIPGPPVAGAAEVSLVGSELRFTAAPGEANRVYVADYLPGEYGFLDEAAPLTAGPGCRPSEPPGRGAQCSAAGVASARVDAGDGDDSVFAFYASLPLVIDGGPGADDLDGGKSGNTILGGDGNDRMAAAASPDPVGNTFEGGAGDDRIGAVQEKIRSPGQKTEALVFEATRDRVVCGDGTDHVAADLLDELADRCESVTLFVRFDQVLLLGTPGDDVVTAPRDVPLRRFRIDGQAGDDVLTGGPYADVVRGGAGRDVLRGGAGDDRILAVDGKPDRVACGAGRDVVSADRSDRVARDCERVARRR